MLYSRSLYGDISKERWVRRSQNPSLLIIAAIFAEIEKDDEPPNKWKQIALSQI